MRLGLNSWFEVRTGFSRFENITKTNADGGRVKNGMRMVHLR